MISVITFGFSPFVAFILQAIVRRQLSNIALVSILIFCFAILSPLLFTRFYYSDLYEGFYAGHLIKAIVISAVLFIVLNLFQKNKMVIAIVMTIVCAFTLRIMGLTVFGRGFVGNGKIFADQRIDGYRIIYRQEADPVLVGAQRVDLYKLALFGLLQRDVTFAYPESTLQNCTVSLEDTVAARTFTFNVCDKKIVEVED